ncbi:MAG: AAA family ATPase [Magnetococcales bacterium]|nr:AAA family ATPase [Magnetococcales bacterium]
MDFNSATGQQSSKSADRLSAEQIKSRLQDSAAEVIHYLLPAGRIRHGKLYVGDVQGNPGDSMEVELTGSKAGMWFDHAAGQGGDIIDLWAAVNHQDSKRDFQKIVEDIASWLGEASNYTAAKPTPKHTPSMDELGPITGKWDYHDRNGQLIACVYRYDPPGGDKEFRPWDVLARRRQAPTPRPLYNIPGIIAAPSVIVVEGEKCASALISAGFQATTTMQGAKSPPEKTDWTPLSGKDVLIWPDKDAPGWDYAQTVATACRNIGCRSVSILIPPTNKPAKWDAADAIAEGMDIHAFLTQVECQEPSHATALQTGRFNLLDWTYNRYVGRPPERKWLIRGVLPLAVPGMIAAIGGAGKSMLALDLAIKVASAEPGTFMPQTAFGGPLEPVSGTAVVLTAEDDQDEIHRRVQALAPEMSNPSRLIVYPLPNNGGPVNLIANGREGFSFTKEFEELRDALLAIRDLRLLVIDPLQSFTSADVNADPAAGSMFFAALGRLAAETGATVLATHHFKKVGNRPILSATDAREAIRGSTSLVDSGRWSYALWSPKNDDAEKACQQLGEEYQRESVFMGAIVKSNWPTDKTVRTYVRNRTTGLLVDRTTELRSDATKSSFDPELATLLITAIQQAAGNGQPFTHYGGTGVYQQRHRLPEVLHDVGRDKLRDLVQYLLNDRRLVKGVASGSREPKWLDVPDGPFARGCGTFEHGADGVYE